AQARVAHALAEADDVRRERALHARAQRAAARPQPAFEDDAAVAIVVLHADGGALGILIRQPFGQTLLGLLAVAVGIDNELWKHAEFSWWGFGVGYHNTGYAAGCEGGSGSLQ